MKTYDELIAMVKSTMKNKKDYDIVEYVDEGVTITAVVLKDVINHSYGYTVNKGYDFIAGIEVIDYFLDNTIPYKSQIDWHLTKDKKIIRTLHTSRFI